AAGGIYRLRSIATEPSNSTAPLHAVPWSNLRPIANNWSEFFSVQELLARCSKPARDGIRPNKYRDIHRCVSESVRQTRLLDRHASFPRDSDHSFQNRVPAGHLRSVAPRDWLVPRNWRQH